MRFQITIPVPKAGQSTPLHLITKKDTIKVVSFKAIQGSNNPTATQYRFTIKEDTNEVIEEVILELQPNGKDGYEELSVDLTYDGAHRMLYVTPLPTETLVQGTLVAPIELDVIRIKEEDDGGWKETKATPASPTQSADCGMLLTE